MSLVAGLTKLGYDSGIFTLMNTQWGWPFVESLHFVGLTLLLGTVGLFDLRLIGFGKQIPVKAFHPLVTIGVFGFLLNTATGLMFVVSDPGQYVYNPAFQIKVLAMIVAGINLAVFYRLIAPLIRNLPDNAPVPAPARLAGFISLSCWCVVIAGGRLITFYRPPEFWCIWC